MINPPLISSLSVSQPSFLCTIWNMSCSTTPVVKHLPQCCISTVGTKTSYPFLSLPSKPIKLTHLSCSSTWVSLSLTNKTSRSIIVPLIAQTSDYAQEDGEEEGSVNGFQLESEVVEVSEDGSVDVGEDGEYQEPPEEAKIFVGNLPFDCDSEKLAHLFQQAGVVEIAEVIYNRDTEQSRGFGFVTMSTVEEAEKAVEMFHRHDLDGRFLTVNKAAPRGSRPERVPRVFEPSFRIYVGNLPWQVDNSRLEQVFSEHGKVLDARVVYDRETGRSRGFGFVTMSCETELNDAIAALDGESLDGRAIRVNVAEERPRRGAF